MKANFLYKYFIIKLLLIKHKILFIAKINLNHTENMILREKFFSSVETNIHIYFGNSN